MDKPFHDVVQYRYGPYQWSCVYATDERYPNTGDSLRKEGQYAVYVQGVNLNAGRENLYLNLIEKQRAGLLRNLKRLVNGTDRDLATAYWVVRNVNLMEPLSDASANAFAKEIDGYIQLTAVQMRTHSSGGGSRKDSLAILDATNRGGWSALVSLPDMLYPGKQRDELQAILQAKDRIDQEHTQVTASRDVDLYEAFAVKNPISPYRTEVDCYILTHYYPEALRDSTFASRDKALDKMAGRYTSKTCDMGQMRNHLQMLSPALLERLTRLAKADYDAQNFESALLTYNEVIQRDNNRTEQYYWRGMVKVELKDCEGANEDLREFGLRGGLGSIALDSTLAASYKKCGRLDSSSVYQAKYTAGIAERKRQEQERLAEQKRAEEIQRNKFKPVEIDLVDWIDNEKSYMGKTFNLVVRYSFRNEYNLRTQERKEVSSGFDLVKVVQPINIKYFEEPNSGKDLSVRIPDEFFQNGSLPNLLGKKWDPVMITVHCYDREKFAKEGEEFYESFGPGPRYLLLAIKRL
jgi:hypothetical protein